MLSTNHHQAKQIWVLMICAQQLILLQFFNTRASSRTISLFLFPIVFGINYAFAWQEEEHFLQTQGFPRHEVSDKQEVLFEDVSPSTALSIRQRRQRRIDNAVDGETSSNKTSCLSLTSCLGNPCVPPSILSQCEWAQNSLSLSWTLSSLKKERCWCTWSRCCVGTSITSDLGFD